MGPGMVSQSEAAEWSIVPSIGVKGVYNDNLLLTPLPHDETYGYWISPAAEFAGKTERFEVSGRVASDFVTYYGGEETRFTNIFLPLSMRYKTETDQFGFTGGLNRDNTLASELLTTGLVLRFTQRNQWTASPSWSRTLTEKLTLETSFQFSDTTYENALRLGLADYQMYGGSGGLRYQLTEYDQIQLSGSYMKFYTTNAPSGFSASIPGFSLNLTHAFTESLTGIVYAGPRFINATTKALTNTIQTRDAVWVFGTSLTKKFESSLLELTLARDIMPSGFGLLIQTDRAGLTLSHNISENLTTSVSTNGYLTSGITRFPQGGTFPDSRYFTVTPKASWRFLEWWRIEVSYTYGRRDIDNFPEAMSNATTIMLSYYPPKLAMSN